MKIINFNEITDKQTIIDYCNKASTDSSMPASKNMSANDWENNTSTLLYALYKSDRFSSNNRAGYFFVEDEKTLIASSGFNPLLEDSNICVLGARSYTIPNKRGKTLHGTLLLPEQINLIKQLKYKTMIFTFNEYNLWLKNLILTLNTRKKLLNHKVPLVYNDWKDLGHKIMLNYTEQYCLYKHIDETYHDSFIRLMDKLKI